MIFSAVVSLVSGAVPARAASSANPGPSFVDLPVVREVQKVWTAEYGVPRPQGLAFDPIRGRFLVVADGPGAASVLRLGTDAEDGGIVEIPRAGQLSSFAFDTGRDALVGVDGTERVVVTGSELNGVRARGRREASTPVSLSRPPRSTAFDPTDGGWLLLDAEADDVVRVRGESVSRLALDGNTDPEMIAVNPADGLLYVLSASRRTLSAIGDDGDVTKVYSLGDVELVDPVAMVFAPSTDATDAGSAHNLFVAETAGASSSGSITEITLAETAALEAAIDDGTLVRVTATSQWNPPSPDPAGVAYNAGTGRLIVVDSEVDETTGAGWNNVNMWETTRAGVVIRGGTFWGANAAQFEGSAGFSAEPTGADFDNVGQRLFVSDDRVRKVFIVQAGQDGLLGNSDDVVSAYDAAPLASTDTEDPAYDPVSGDLFLLDGIGREIYRIDPVDGVFGDANDTFTQFDISWLGPTDFEGLTRDPVSGSLYVGSRSTKEVFELSETGVLLRVISLTNLPNLRFISGLQMAPSSVDSTQNNLYVVDRAIDNGPNPAENDGLLFEVQISAPPVGSPPVAVNDAASTPQDTPVRINVAANDSDLDGDLLPGSAVTLTAPQAGTTIDNGDGTIDYRPNPMAAGVDSFTYRICDAAGSCSTATVTVTVSDTPDPPIAVDDTVSAPTATAVVIDVAANDNDPDGDLDPASAVTLTAPTSGTTTDNGNGTITYLSAQGFAGVDSFTYRICDSTPVCGSATVTVAVGGGQKWFMSFSSSETVAGIAVAVRDEDIVSYDPVANVWEMFFDASDMGITTNDLDALHVRADGSVMLSFSSDGLVIPGLTGGPNGELIDDEDLVVFTPTSSGETTAGSFSFYLDGSDVGLAAEDIDGLAEFTDGSLGISTDSSFSLGSWTGQDSDVIVFAPTTVGTNTSGSWTQLYFDASDIGMTSTNDDLAGVTFDVVGDLLYTTLGVNSAPGSNNEDVNRFSGTFGPLTAGTASLELDLSALGIDPANAVDGLHLGLAGGGSGNPQPPVAVDDTATTPEDTAVVIDVAANDTDPDGDLDPASVTTQSGPTTGSTTDNGDGTITYLPAQGFAGVDSFTYRICDLTALCDTATVTITVGNGNRWYVSLSSDQTIAGIAGVVRDEDIVTYDPASGSWAMYFDASDVGITSSDLDAFHIRDDGSVLMSFSTKSLTIPGLIGGPDGGLITRTDLILFTPTSVGDDTAGTFSFYFDGSDVGLTTNSEDIVGLHEFAGGTLAISTLGSASVGSLTAQNEDILLFSPTGTGSNTAGAWTALHFDGSDLGLSSTADDLAAISFDANGDLFFVTRGLNLLGTTSTDINRFTGTFGANTSGTVSLELALAQAGITSTNTLDGLHAAG